jgi:hypothetical protein
MSEYRVVALSQKPYRVSALGGTHRRFPARRRRVSGIASLPTMCRPNTRRRALL